MMRSFAMFWQFHRVYNPERQYTDHFRNGPYTLSLPQGLVVTTLNFRDLYAHVPKVTQQPARRTTRDTPAQDVSAPEARAPVTRMHWDKS